MTPGRAARRLPHAWRVVHRGTPPWRSASRIRATHARRAKGGRLGVRGFPAPRSARRRCCRCRPARRRRLGLETSEFVLEPLGPAYIAWPSSSRPTSMSRGQSCNLASRGSWRSDSCLRECAGGPPEGRREALDRGYAAPAAATAAAAAAAAAARMAAAESLTSSSVVRQFETEMRIACSPFHSVPPSQHVPSR